MTQQSNKIREDWEKEFDDKFFNDLYSTGGSEYAMFNETKNVKDFIRKLLSTVQEETRKEEKRKVSLQPFWYCDCRGRKIMVCDKEYLLASLTPTKTEEKYYMKCLGCGGKNEVKEGVLNSVVHHCQSTEKGKHE